MSPEIAHALHGLGDCSMQWILRQRRNSPQISRKTVVLVGNFYEDLSLPVLSASRTQKSAMHSSMQLFKALYVIKHSLGVIR